MKGFDSSLIAILNTFSQELDLPLSSEMLKRLHLFSEFLLTWNMKMHLVSKKDANPERGARQIIDSLLILHYFKIAQNARILDIGSGAGFPAIPLKLARPDLEMVLTESTRKKAAYLQSAITELKLERMEVFPDRAGNLSKKYFGYFDYATAKASGKLEKNWMEVHKFLRNKGKFLTYKGRGLNQELTGVREVFKNYPGEIEEIKTIDIKELDLGGYLVSLRKL
jgi:16S rRNA (guanine527-N7)-methyltransferase